MTEHELLAQAIGDDGAAQIQGRSGEVAIPSPPGSSRPTEMDLCQWQVSPNGIFRPAAKTIPNLVPGAYFTGQDDFGPFLKQQELLSDAAVMCLDHSYADVLVRLRAMTRRPREVEGFAKNTIGLVQQAQGAGGRRA